MSSTLEIQRAAGTVRVVTIRSPFRPEEADEIRREIEPGLPIRSYRPEGFPDLPYVAMRNGVALDADGIEEEPAAGDELLFAFIPGEPGTIVTVILLIISVAASIISAVMAPRLSSREHQDEDGPSRAFTGIQNTTQNGTPIPFGYGRVRTGGHIIQSFERQATREQIEGGGTTLYTLIALGWGPVQSISDFEINGQKLDTLDGVVVETRLGANDQAPILNFEEAVTAKQYNRPVLHSEGPQDFETEETDAFEIVFSFDALFRVTKSGDSRPMTVEFRVHYREVGFTGGGYRYFDTWRVTGRSRNLYKSIFRSRDLDRARWQIRVERVTLDDGVSLDTTSPGRVFSIQEIKESNSTHPGMALVAYKQIPSAQLGNTPPQTYTQVVEWNREVRVYSDTETYALQYTANPAWCWAHWITNPDYGLGETYERHIDIQSLIDLAAKFDEGVDRGDGILEPRALIAATFDRVEGGQDIMQSFASAFGCVALKRGIKWRFLYDEPEDVVWIANAANASGFKLRFVPKRERANRLYASFLDQDLNWERDSHPEELPGLTQDDDYIEATVEMFLTDRRTQVSRELVRQLAHNKYGDEEVEIETTLSALRVGAYSVIGVANSALGIGLASGRLIAVDSTTAAVRIDERVTIESGKEYELVLIHKSDNVSSARVLNQPGTTDRVFINAADLKAPAAAGEQYTIGLRNGAYSLFRVRRITLESDWKRRIVAARYDPAIYAGNLNAPSTTLPTSLPNPRAFPPDPTHILVTEDQLKGPDGSLREVLFVDWVSEVSSLHDHFLILVRELDAENWEVLARVDGERTRAEITSGIATPDVTYDLVVQPVSPFGARKSPELLPRVRFTTEGILEQPPTPTSLTAALIEGTLYASVQAIPDLGPAGYYEWRIGSSWGSSILLARTPEPRLEIASYPHQTVDLLVKAVNSAGNESPQAAAYSIELRGRLDENVIQTVEYEDPWPGSWIGFKVGAGGELTLHELGSALAPRPRFRPRRGGLRTYGPGAPDPRSFSRPSGTYTTPILQIVPTGPALVFSRPDVAVEYTALDLLLGTFDAAAFPFFSERAKRPFDGNVTDEIQITREARYSATDTEEASFTAWAPLADRGEIQAKYAQFRVSAAVVGGDRFSVQIDKVTVSIDVPDVHVVGKVSISTPNSVNVTFTPAFQAEIRGVSFGLEGAAVGVSYRVTALSLTGLTVELRDSGGSLTSPGTFHYTLRGY